MSSSLPAGSDSEASSNASSEKGTSPASAARNGGHDRSLKPSLGLAVLAAPLAAAAAWGLGESGLFEFRPAIANLNMMGHPYRDASPQTRETARLEGASCVLGTFGALLGAGMGLVGGRASRSPGRTLLAAGLGLLAGALAGAAPLWFVIPAYNRAEELTSGDLTRSLLMHWGLWTALGAAAGFALGIGLGKRGKFMTALCGGIAGVVVGTFVYEFLGGALFPLAETGKPFSDTATTRLLALLFVAVFSATGAVLFTTSLGKTTRGTS
ncbi:MAG: hypothetical protein ACP5XB_16715 [Isosphaeraceae bacterium]